MNFKNKKGQIAIYVIVAILLVGTIVLFYAFREKIFPPSIPADFVPVFTNYESCMKEETRAAIDLAGSQGGRIYSGEYIPGSDYAPFSSHLNFLGFPVPYWYYIAGNGLVKENVPTKSEMEKDIAEYINERLNNCRFDNFYPQGFYVEMSEPKAEVNVQDSKITVDVTAPLTVTREGESARKADFTFDINSKLGKFHTTAIEIYELEKQNAVLENYAIDTLWNYAPVDGVEIQCAPKVWTTRTVTDDLKKGLEANMGAIKFKGSYYTLKNKENNYFVINQPVDEPVRLIYSSKWPTKVEISGEGVSEDIIVSEAVGNREGLGLAGFCYVPYHFIYDVSFPVMVQIGDGTELFQFPLAVIIDNNQPRVAEVSPDMAEGQPAEFNFCQYKTQPVTISTYDTGLNPINANVSYSCFDQRCIIGETQNGKLEANLPACINGFIEARAEGYTDNSKLFSSNEESFAEMILDKEYEISVSVKKAGEDLAKGSSAIVLFTNRMNNNITTSATIPGFNRVKLSEGLYEVKAYVYDNSTIKIPASKKSECFDANKGGLLGFFGMTKEQCINIEIPSTTIDYALSGGGSSESYIMPSDLATGKLIVNVDSLPKPQSLEALGDNIEKIESKGVDLIFG